MTKKNIRPALFLDRDGVINIEKNYVHKIDEIVFIDGIFELCRKFKEAGFAIVVVTNQAGIGRGFYTEAQFWVLMNWMRAHFAEHSIIIDAVYFCPYHPEHGVGPYMRESADRKPNPGMILRAQADLNLDLSSSWMIGDRATDIEAARSAGVGKTILLTLDDSTESEKCQPDWTVRSLGDALNTLFSSP